MANTIITKNSSTASAVPTSGDLVQGELAVNVTDKRLFTEDSGGTVVELGVNPTSVTTGNLAYTGTLTGGTGVVNLGSGQVYKDASGNVGIGTSAPTAVLASGRVLEVSSGESSEVIVGKTSANISSGANIGGFAFKNIDGSLGTAPHYAGIRSKAEDTSGNMDLRFYTGTSNYENDTPQMRIDSAGNVGIGTSSANKSSSSTALTVNTPSAANYAALELSSGDTLNWHINSNNAAVYDVTSGTRPRIFYTNGSERIRIDSAGNVGIGTSSPAENLHISATTPVFRLEGGSRSYQQFVSGTDFVIRDVTATTNRITLNSSGNVGIGTSSPTLNTNGTVLHINNSTASRAALIHMTNAESGSTGADGLICGKWSDGTNYFFDYGSNPIVFGTSGSERARIDTSGNLLIGLTSNTTTFSSRLVLSYNSGTTQWGVGPWINDGTKFYISANGGAQGVYLNGAGATSWTAWSDERFKDIIEPITDAANKVSTLRAVIGKYKTDDEGVRRSFLIAQDIQAVLPEAVDASNPDKLGVQYTEVIPLLVAAIKELKAEIESLTARVSALEGN